ncbi:ATP-dependent transcriptional regulator [Pseudomonas sp. L-22-4S-12]|uniref:LuxR C-terminal-related transcriptional regulator n=1 Tax=Pseudomonas sp. L-22-4S-12 TaxID=2610893 RepID=UPI00132606CC|nr:LuxR C-terminal-related transcriptional regulator [Pseudomonas sp. L-22-4S-12]MWV17025.1 ATP-dependent transcriptional regulator [Pseudomonas sp. L-22-4S-12]
MQTTVMNSENLLVATKFSPPRLNTRHIPRVHLLGRLREAQDSTATLITGGAGFGKTILLAQWRQVLMKAGVEVAWLSFSHDDKEFQSFFSYLLAALQHLGIQIDGEMLNADGGDQSMNAVVAVVTRAAEEIGRELYLLIDDYQHIEAPSAHRLIQKLLDHCPANLHIVIASRTIPPLSLGRLRMQGYVAEIDFAELPFDLDETRAFFEQNLTSLALTADEERLIHDLTGGWPASLQPIATMLRVRPAKRAKLRSLLWKSSDLQAYLAEDVVACLPEELVELMEKISIFRRFNAELAEFVAQDSRAVELIKLAEDENLLIYRVDSDDSLPWYRFHPLFGEFLAQRLAQQGQAVIEALHGRASQWFAEHDFLAESIRHANLSGDLDYAVSALEEAATTTWSMAYIGPMLHLLDRLPQETLFSHPRLFVLGCLTYALTARPEKAERWLEQIRRTEAAKNPAISSRFALADAAVAMQLDDLKRVIDLLEPALKAPVENRSLRYISLSALVVAYLAMGRFEDVRRLFDDNPINPDDRDNDMAMVFESNRALAYLTKGSVREAERIGAGVLARAENAYGRGSVAANLCASTLSDAFYELDRIDDALAVLANRSGILQFSMPDVMARASLCRSRIEVLRGEPQEALRFLEDQAAHFHLLGLSRPQATMIAEQAAMLLSLGDRRHAGELMARLQALVEAQGGNAGAQGEIAAISALVRARITIADRDPAAALVALAEVRRFAERYGRGRAMVKTNLLAALAHDIQGQTETAAAALAQALQTGATLGLVRTLLDESEAMQLLERLRGVIPLDTFTEQYLADLLSHLADEDGAPGAALSRETAGGQPAVLTPRELEILSLISQAMSNKRIALTLNLTFGTVKWNVKNILAKLGVSSRYGAITTARQQGLLK